MSPYDVSPSINFRRYTIDLACARHGVEHHAISPVKSSTDAFAGDPPWRRKLIVAFVGSEDNMRHSR